MRIPGFLWSLGIAVAIFAMQTLLPAEYAIYGSAAVVAILAMAKGFNLQTDEIDKLVADLHAASPRGAAVPLPRQRGKLERWLVG